MAISTINNPIPSTQPSIFIPLQVPEDSQIRVFWFFKVIDYFVETILNAAQHWPTNWHIRVKEHPSAKIFLETVISKASLENVTDGFEQAKKCIAGRDHKLVSCIRGDVF